MKTPISTYFLKKAFKQGPPMSVFSRLCSLFKTFKVDENNDIRPKKVVLFPKSDRLKIFLSLTHPHSRMCIRIYVFN